MHNDSFKMKIIESVSKTFSIIGKVDLIGLRFDTKVSYMLIYDYSSWTSN